MQLYVKRNLYLSDINAVKEMAEGGKVAVKWEKYVSFFANWTFYFHILRILINFLKTQGALVGKFYTYAVIGCMFLIYLCVALLVLSMTKVQAVNLNVESISTDNKILQTTLTQLQEYTDKTSRFGFCLFLIIIYSLSEGLNLFL